MKTTTIAAFALLGLAAGTAHAHHPYGPGVNHRQAQQHLRIDGGVASGALTRGETRFLAGQQRSIRAEERLYRYDGVLTAAERVDLHRDINRASRRIWIEKHDAERRN
jgi:hypothetical protein